MAAMAPSSISSEGTELLGREEAPLLFGTDLLLLLFQQTIFGIFC